jgi:hypothetical protein
MLFFISTSCRLPGYRRLPGQRIYLHKTAQFHAIALFPHIEFQLLLCTGMVVWKFEAEWLAHNGVEVLPFKERVPAPWAEVNNLVGRPPNRYFH